MDLVRFIIAERMHTANRNITFAIWTMWNTRAV